MSLDLAIQLASDLPVIRRRNKQIQRIAAVCADKRGRVISYGINDYKKSHPIMAMFAELVGEPAKVYLHAEVLSLIRSKDIPVDTIYIARVGNQGMLLPAKPCIICQRAIEVYGVNRVIHT